jgi:hypothetical protein
MERKREQASERRTQGAREGQEKEKERERERHEMGEK